MLRNALFATATAACATFVSAGANAQYTYDTPIITEMPGSTCITATHAGDVNTIHTVMRTWMEAPGGDFLFCPLQRRNLAAYGMEGWMDLVSMTELRVVVEDQSPTDYLSCVPFTHTHAGSTLFGATLFATQNGGSQDLPPDGSFMGKTELVWTDPFGGNSMVFFAINNGYRCFVPQGSMIHSARGTYNPN